MSFRTVVISRQSKISYKNRYLVVKRDNDEKYVHLSEIDTIVVDSVSVSISAYLLRELADAKINIIFVMKIIILLANLCLITRDIIQVK